MFTQSKRLTEINKLTQQLQIEFKNYRLLKNSPKYTFVGKTVFQEKKQQKKKKKKKKKTIVTFYKKARRRIGFQTKSVSEGWR